MTENPRPLFFMHVPKTAGMSLRAVLSRRFGPTDILEINDTDDRREELVNQVARYPLVAGHAGFGLVHAFGRRPLVITFMREPVDRAVSAYYFLREREIESFREQETQRDSRRAKELSLLDFIRHEPAAAARHLGNLQTRFLGANDPQGQRLQALGKESGEAARANLASCDCIGLTERSKDSLALLCHTMGWPAFPEMPNTNRTPQRPHVNDLDSATLATLRDLTRLDAELYQHAIELFAQRWRQFANRHDQREASTNGGAGVVFTFDQAISGANWYGSEWVAGRWCSWTGPRREAWLELKPVPSGEAILRVHVVHVLRPEILSGVGFLVNGKAVTARHRCDASGTLFEAPVPSALLAPGLSARLTIQVPEVLRPCDLDCTNPDSRLLGVLVDRIELTPAD